MSSQLESLSYEILQSVLIFAANDAKTLLRCEITSKALRIVVQDDRTWQFVVPESSPWHARLSSDDQRLKCYRTRSLYWVSHMSIRREQKSIRNILVDELGVAGFHALVTSIISVLGLHLDHDTFLFRGDTLFVLSELIQDNMIGVLRRALLASEALSSATQQYPVVTIQEIRLMWQDAPAFMQQLRALPLPFDPLRNRIVRRLCHRAGIVRMENDAYDWTWRSLEIAIYLCTRRACIELVSIKPSKPYDANNLALYGQEKRLLALGETIRDVPPLPRAQKCSCCPEGGIEYVHTVVPRQIEEGAQSVFGNHAKCKVYGNFWLVPHTPVKYSSLEVAKAEAQYEFEDGHADDDEEYMSIMSDVSEIDAMYLSEEESDDGSEGESDEESDEEGEDESDEERDDESDEEMH